MTKNLRLVFSGEYSSWWVNETPEFKEALYEIMLEHLVKTGEIFLDSRGVMDEKKLVEYAEKEFNHKGDYKILKGNIEKGIKELDEYRKNKDK